MKLKNRKIVGYLLMLVFVLAAPAVLLYASGYRYNWHKHKVEKTGLIFVDTEPEGAVVAVDGERAKEVTPVTVPNLMPEEYRVTISLEGYLSWSKTLRVESGRTTFAKGVTLLRDSLPQLIKDKDIVEAAFSNDGTAVAYMSEDNEWNELSLFDIRTDDEILLARFAKDKYSDVLLELSVDGSYLLFSGKEDGMSDRTYLVYPADISRNGAQIATSLGGRSGLEVKWSKQGSTLLAYGDSGAFVADKSDGSLMPLPSGRHIRDVFFFNNDVWVIREGAETALLERLSPDGRTVSETFIALPRKGYSFVDGNWRYLVLTDGRAGGGLLVDTDNAGLRELPHATGMEWEQPDLTGVMLLWNDWEIFTVDPDEKDTVLITRIGTGITDCDWHPEEGYLFYSGNDSVTAIETDGRDKRNIYGLVGFDSVTSMRIDREASILRFTGSIGNQRGIFERPL
jgi:WD40 repeat protein